MAAAIGCIGVGCDRSAREIEVKDFALADASSGRFDWPSSAEHFRMRPRPIYSSMLTKIEGDPDPRDVSEVELPIADDATWQYYAGLIGLNPDLPTTDSPRLSHLATSKTTPGPARMALDLHGDSLVVVGNRSGEHSGGGHVVCFDLSSVTVDRATVDFDLPPEMNFGGTPRPDPIVDPPLRWQTDMSGYDGEPVLIAYSGDHSRIGVVTRTDGWMIDAATGRSTSMRVPAAGVDALVAARDADCFTMIDGEGGVHVCVAGSSTWDDIGVRMDTAGDISGIQPIGMTVDGTQVLGFNYGAAARYRIDGSGERTFMTAARAPGNAMTTLGADNHDLWMSPAGIHREADSKEQLLEKTFKDLLHRPVYYWSKRPEDWASGMEVTVLGIIGTADDQRWAMWHENSHHAYCSSRTELAPLSPGGFGYPFKPNDAAGPFDFAPAEAFVPSGDGHAFALRDSATGRIDVYQHLSDVSVTSANIGNLFRTMLDGKASTEHLRGYDRFCNRLRQIDDNRFIDGRTPEDFFDVSLMKQAGIVCQDWVGYLGRFEKALRTLEKFPDQPAQWPKNVRTKVASYVEEKEPDDEALIAGVDNASQFYRERIELYRRRREAFDAAFDRDNVNAQLMIAKAHMAFGWENRGSGYADSITREGGIAFREHGKKAGEIAERLLEGPRPPIAAMTLLLDARTATGGNYHRIDPLLIRGYQLAPYSSNLARWSTHLQHPAWGGDMQRYQALIGRALPVGPAKDRDRAYAAFVSTIRDEFRGDNEFYLRSADQPRMNRGMRLWLESGDFVPARMLARFLKFTKYSDQPELGDQIIDYLLVHHPNPRDTLMYTRTPVMDDVIKHKPPRFWQVPADRFKPGR